MADHHERINGVAIAVLLALANAKIDTYHSPESGLPVKAVVGPTLLTVGWWVGWSVGLAPLPLGLGLWWVGGLVGGSGGWYRVVSGLVLGGIGVVSVSVSGLVLGGIGVVSGGIGGGIGIVTLKRNGSDGYQGSIAGSVLSVSALE